jgi:hypothetical protein
MGDDRRGKTRLDALVVVRLGEGHVGVTRNASERGLLVATQIQVAVGDRLELVVGAKTGPIPVRGRVVRVEEPPGAELRYLVAIELDDALPRNVIEDGAKAAGDLLPPSSNK